ncbi:hypothetical protein M378DRAFT_174507, partial [Amanita muscaria Koide BX008]
SVLTDWLITQWCWVNTVKVCLFKPLPSLLPVYHANFAAHVFAPPILITPLLVDALRIIIGYDIS